MSLFRRRRAALACRDAVELVTDYLEDALSRAERARFEEHLAGCPHCSAYLEQIRMTIAVAGRVEPEELSPAAQEDLVALYRRWQQTG
jgi:anti-sigma factor RsiW